MKAGLPEDGDRPAQARSAPSPFTIEPLDAPDGVVALRLEGELDLATGAGVREAIDAALAAGTTGLLLDLEEVTFMDSSMLRELLRAQGELRSRGGPVVLMAPRPAVLRLLELTGTAALFAVAVTREDGLARAMTPA